MNKINISNIIKGHLATLVNDNTKKPSFGDYFTFLFIPILISSLLVYFCVFLNNTSINIIVTSLAILVGLLFNVLVLIFDITKRDKDQIKNKVLIQLNANISFTIIISIFTILFIFLTYVNNCVFLVITHWIIYFSLVLFILTVFMIIKRTYLLFENEIKKS